MSKNNKYKLSPLTLVLTSFIFTAFVFVLFILIDTAILGFLIQSKMNETYIILTLFALEFIPVIFYRQIQKIILYILKKVCKPTNDDIINFFQTNMSMYSIYYFAATLYVYLTQNPILDPRILLIILIPVILTQLLINLNFKQQVEK